MQTQKKNEIKKYVYVKKECLKFYSGEDKRQQQSYVYEENATNDGKVKQEKQDIRMVQQ